MKICDSMKLDVLKLGFCCVVFDLAQTDFMVTFRVIPESLKETLYPQQFTPVFVFVFNVLQAEHH